MAQDTQDDNGSGQQQAEKPEMTSQGFVAKTEFPRCPECGHRGFPVIAYKPESGLQGLHCKECGRILTHVQPASAAIEDEDRHYAAIGENCWGTGDTEEEAVENMKEFLDEDSARYYSLWVSNSELQVSKYGSVHAEDGSQVILHNMGKRRIRGDLDGE